MQKPFADAWALEILNHIAGRESFETHHIELKSQLVTAKDFASQLGGLGNAARWHPVMVLFGVDRRAIPGVDPFEIGDWYASVQACFEYGEAPRLAYSNFLRFNEKTVAVMVFETDNPPYVVGPSKRGGPREVPWRYGSKTGPAGRAELLQVLTQRLGDPEIEIFKIELKGGSGNMSLRVEMFVYPAPASELVIPFHRIDATASEPNGVSVSFATSVSLTPLNIHASLARLTDSAVVVPTPSRLHLVAFSEQGKQIPVKVPVVEVAVSMSPAHFDHPVRVVAQIDRRDHPDFQAYWELPSAHDKRLNTVADELKKLELMAPKSRVPRS